MKTLALYLWKEWRDHRAIVIGIAIAAPLLLGLAALLLPHQVVHDPLFCALGAAGCFAMVALSLAGDLIPGEARRETLGFLRRLPSDLGVAFVAKLLFLAVALALLTAWGYGAAALLGGVPGTFDGRFLLAVAVVPWLFAVSSWLPRGALALPASLLVLALLGLPLYLLYDPAIGLKPRPQDVAAYIAFAAVASLPVAWISFVRGYRFGRGPLRAAIFGLGAALLLVSPLWAHAAFRSHEFHAFDFDSEECLIGGGVAGKGGRFLFLNARMPGEFRPNRAIRLDLADGSWSELGRPNDNFEIWPGAPLPMVRLREEGSAAPDERNPGRVKWWCHFFDGRSGKKLRSGWSNMSVSGSPMLYRAGLGWWEEGGLFDPFRGRLFPRKDLDLGWTYCVRPGLWLAWNLRQLKLFDPDTGEMSDIKGVQEHIFPSLVSDGRVLAFDRGRDEIALVDPQSGEREVIRKGRADFYPVAASANLYGLRDGERYRFARLDTGLQPIGETVWRTCEAIATLEDGAVLCILDYRRIVRVFSDRVETLWPR